MRSSTDKVVIGLAAFALAACNSDNNGVNSPCVPVGAQFLSQNIPAEMTSHIPAVVKKFTDRGALSQSQVLPVTVALSLNNEDELDQRIAEMYRPGSPNFHKFITAEEFRERYAPTAVQVADAQAYLQSHGITATSVSANGVLISAIGTTSTLSEIFQTQIHQYNDGKGSTYFAPASEPKMPAGLSIRAVHGMQNVTHIHSHAHAGAVDVTSPHAGRGPGGGMSPADIRSAYNVPTQVNGSGQTLALVELDGYSASDIAAYENSFGQTQVPLQNIYVDGYSGAAGSGRDEVTLDIELMTAVAPGASRILVYEAPNTSQGLLDLYARIASDNAASQVSTSWGMAENETTTSFLQTENAIFKQMAVQGQSFYAATGDSGAYDNGSNISVDDPASQPFVVAVGGTHLAENGGVYQSESTWNNGSPSMGAGGGGVSTIWSQPSWQNGLSTAANKGSGSMRNIPDVSLNADPNVGYSIYVGGQWTIYGGTSCAAPLWAAYTALVNQQRKASGLSVLGFTDPYLYAIGGGSRAQVDFHDVQDGSTNLYYPAVRGYDDATGWGSFDGQSLFEDLTTEPTVSAEQLSC